MHAYALFSSLGVRSASPSLPSPSPSIPTSGAVVALHALRAEAGEGVINDMPPFVVERSYTYHMIYHLLLMGFVAGEIGR